MHRKRRNRKLEKKLERLQRERYNEAYITRQQQILQRIKVSSRVTKEERQVLAQLKKNAREDIDEWDKDGKPINKFRIRHVDNLGIPYDVFFMFGKKGIGKTVQLREYCRKLLDEDPKAQIFLIRNTREEMAALEAQLNSSSGDPKKDWPCVLFGEKLYRRPQAGRGAKTTARLKHCGYATYMSGSGLVKWKGGEYGNIRAIIWDECNNESSIFRFNKSIFLSFVNFISSIVRDKKGVKIFMFGNLLRNANGTVNNSILRAMGIDQQSELKIIKIPTLDNSDITTLIYWNSLNAYHGFEKGKLTTIFRNVDVTELGTNKPLPVVSKILDESEWADCYPLYAWVFTHTNKKYTLFYGYFDFDGLEERKFPPGKYYSLRIEEFDPNLTYGYRLSTIDVSIKNNHPGLIKHMSEDDWIDFLENLYDQAEIGRVWYGTEETELLFSELFKSWTTKYNLTYERRESF